MSNNEILFDSLCNPKTYSATLNILLELSCASENISNFDQDIINKLIKDLINNKSLQNSLCIGYILVNISSLSPNFFSIETLKVLSDRMYEWTSQGGLKNEDVALINLLVAITSNISGAEGVRAQVMDYSEFFLFRWTYMLQAVHSGELYVVYDKDRFSSEDELPTIELLPCLFNNLLLSRTSYVEDHFLIEHDILLDLFKVTYKLSTKSILKYTYDLWTNVFIWANNAVSGGNEKVIEAVKNKFNHSEIIEQIKKYANSENMENKEFIARWMLMFFKSDTAYTGTYEELKTIIETEGNAMDYVEQLYIKIREIIKDNFENRIEWTIG